MTDSNMSEAWSEPPTEPGADATQNSAAREASDADVAGGRVRARPHGIDSELLPLFLVLTGDDTSAGWGKQAGQYIRHTRRTTGVSPTFSELFDALLSEQEIWAAPFPSAARYRFRHDVAIHWRRTLWIRFTTRTRSLSEGSATFHSKRRPREKTGK